MGGSIGHRCTVWGGSLLDIGVLYGGVYWTYVLYGGSIGHRCTVWGGGLLDICAVWGSIGHRCTVWGGLLDIGVLYGGVYWT